MQNTIKILIVVITFFCCGLNLSAQSEVKQKKEEIVVVDGISDTIKILGEGLWFEFKKKLNLVDEEELKKNKTYKVRIGKVIIEKQVPGS